MKTRISKLLCFLALSSTSSFFAQNSIKGIVTNEQGETLPGVSIRMKNTYEGTQTNDKGNYELSNIKADSVQLQYSFLGYETKMVTVLFKEPTIEKNIQLTISSKMMEEVQVSAIRAENNTPTTYTNLNKEEINQGNFGQDLPFLLRSTPSTVVTSDAGAGVGYTGISIRGVDPTRTNVTVNGIPLNDAESHGVWWVNMPDFASSTENIQIQRGVGSSTNGAAAFGASINIKTDNIQQDAYATIDNSVGSFNTFKNNVKVGTGIINEKFSFDARLSQIKSDGFIDRASSDLKSYFLSGAYIGNKTLVKANMFIGNERTYQAWYGVPEAKYDGDTQGLINHYYNNLGSTYETKEDSVNLFSDNDRTYNYYDYKNEVDNYTQKHYQLHLTHSFNTKLNVNVSGHYTKGYGYYEQYRNNDEFDTYGLTPVVYSNDTVTSTDLIRRRWLDNDYYGAIFALNYTNLKNLKLVFGGDVNQYVGKHYGEIIWARNASSSEINQNYYDNDATKNTVSTYLKGNYSYHKFNFYADLQLRNIYYAYLGNQQTSSGFTALTQNVNFTFFNPKAGLTYNINNISRIYGSYAVSNREPVRNDFVNSSNNSQPKPENLQNIEVGYKLNKQKYFFNANYYMMYYKDQLILTGEINDVGAYVRSNVDESYRTGVELEFGYQVLKTLSFSGNLMLSQNKIKAFNEYIDSYDSNWNWSQEVVEHKNTDIAFSPNTIVSLGLMYEPVKNLEIGLTSKYVGKQFLDNTSSDSRSLDAYYLTNMNISYATKFLGFKEVKFGLLVNNILDFKYANNGYTWGYNFDGTRIVENYVYPQAGRNFLLRATFNF